MIQEDGNLGWKTSDVAEGFDELTKNDLSQTFWRLAVPFVKKERKLILSQLPAASAIYREWATYGNRSPQKSLMIKVCSLPFMSKSLYQRFVATLDPEVKTLMEYLALKGPLSHLMIEKELAITTYEKEYQEGGMHRYNRPSIKLLPQFRVLPYREPYSYYYGREAKIVFLLPKLLQKIVAILSSPIEARLPSYPELPDSAKKMNVFYGEELILRELPGLIIFLNNKRPKLSKKGRPNAASIRALGKKLALTEFYPATKQKELMHMRANMLASLLLQLDDLPNNASPPDLIKHLFAKTYPQQFRSALHLLTYVNGVSSLRAPAFRKVEHDSVEYFQPLYEQGWVEHKDWQHQKERTAYHIDFVEPRELNRLMLEVPGEFTSSSFSTTMEVAPFYGQKLIQWPILRAHLFLFAAWGLLDLVCEEPNCKGIGYTCDSPYDGVRYIRLTPLGAYVLGYTDEYESEITQPFELELSDDVLSILLTAGDMELASRAIASFARPVGSKRFQTNADMFLQDCNTAKDLKQKIDLFSTLFPGDLPSNWQTFFKELSQKANPLTEEEFLVFSINPNDQKLLQLLAQDEKIRELCSKAEGYRILVRTKDFKRLQKLLRAYGYLVE
jgi:hypothetical protein